jgi:hypothetical protein
VLPFNLLGVIQPLDPATGQPDTSKNPVQAGCLQCHIGDGQVKGIFGDNVADGTITMDQTPQSAKQGIDCLLCHAGINADAPAFAPNGDPAVYKQRLLYQFDLRKAVKVADDDPEKPLYPAGFKMQQDRTLETAKTVGGRPEFANCFYPCHGYSGGGYENKKGARFEPEHDVHAARGVQCVDCHKVDGHKFAAGITADIYANDDWSVVIECASCHSEKPHANRMIDQHTDKLDCTVCHITHIVGGIKTRDWTGEPKRLDNGTFAPPSVKNTTEIPTYLWWDKQDTEINPATGMPLRHTAMPQLRQERWRSSETAKIYTFKNSRFTVPWDTEHDQVIYVKAGKYNQSAGIPDTASGKTGWQIAFEVGMNDALARGLRAGTSPWTWDDTRIEDEVEEVNYQVTHMVKAGAEAWTCNDCHNPNPTVLDYEMLGYSAERIAELSTPR